MYEENQQMHLQFCTFFVIHTYMFATVNFLTNRDIFATYIHNPQSLSLWLDQEIRNFITFYSTRTSKNSPHTSFIVLFNILLYTLRMVAESDRNM